jgi:hypothetical protein
MQRYVKAKAPVVRQNNNHSDEVAEAFASRIPTSRFVSLQNEEPESEGNNVVYRGKPLKKGKKEQGKTQQSKRRTTRRCRKPHRS